MKIPDNIYMNICKVFQEIYKNKFELNELNIAEVGSRGKKYDMQIPHYRSGRNGERDIFLL